ncbi:dipeptide ABC transporter ATP-binding protein [Microlunatus parietis]|uniref:Peptide/nickel transport system ATP-binding protein n=1 Tax=Microlunatus parietis TaxID=682979 RepID=A0A7Y9IC05_9ACTN|nr:ABC transporter ATP-binding protein [Microlunatus parietis]NYE73945.1 peptide/nickel transport system ATP-binding protein [Microlunatus parietis]
MTLLAIRDLAVHYRTARGPVTAVDGVSLEVEAGQVTALVGESGSGKSSVAQSIIGLLPSNGRIAGGSIALQGTELVGLPDRRWRSIRGARIGLIPQDPGNSLNPVARIGDSVAEALRIHGWRDRTKINTKVYELLERVDLDDPKTRARQYPHELSGGMRQRVLIAAALALEPELIIADEPTSALDVTVQRRVLDLLDRLRTETGTGVLFITHDLAVAADRADTVVVMRDGAVRERGDAAEVLSAPADDYTRTLLADAPSLTKIVERPQRPEPPAPVAPLVDVSGLRQEFRRPGRSPLVAVDDVSFTVARGTTHALVGESGSGKTTIGRVITGFQRPTAGGIRIGDTEVVGLRSRRAFHRSAQLVYQNPYASLDPRQTVAKIIAEPLRNFRIGDRAEQSERVERYLDLVSLAPEYGARRPHELSGGQRQRVAIARALILEPELVVLDEAVSALDVTVQAQILRLLARLQEELSLTYVFISHDLAVVRQIADTVSVLQRGRQVEHGATDRIFEAPEHDYTRQLIAAIPGTKIRETTRRTG